MDVYQKGSSNGLCLDRLAPSHRKRQGIGTRSASIHDRHERGSNGQGKRSGCGSDERPARHVHLFRQRGRQCHASTPLEETEGSGRPSWIVQRGKACFGSCVAQEIRPCQSRRKRHQRYEYVFLSRFSGLPQAWKARSRRWHPLQYQWYVSPRRLLAIFWTTPCNTAGPPNPIGLTSSQITSTSCVNLRENHTIWRVSWSFCMPTTTATRRSNRYGSTGCIGPGISVAKPSIAVRCTPACTPIPVHSPPFEANAKFHTGAESVRWRNTER